jgi:two-component system, OmpR family, phosphate regulon sensor histidine kinase PhoR
MFGFRRKIFLGYIAVFFLLIVMVFPIVSKWVHQTVIYAMDEHASVIIGKIMESPNNEALVRRLRDQKSSAFFRMSIITNEQKILYDTHTRRMLGAKFSQDYIVHHPEVLQALQKGSGYHEDYSSLLGQKFAYYAKSFNFHDKNFVLRTAVPHQYVVELTKDFIVGFLILITFILLLFSFMTWLMILRLTRPIQEIISSAESYQEGQPSTLPFIDTDPSSEDEFGKLASTINSLSLKIRNDIETLTYERNEKETLLDSLEEGVIAVDENMKISYINYTASKLLHIDLQNYIRKSFSHINQEHCETLLWECQQVQKPLTSTLELNNHNQKLYLDIVAAPKKDRDGAILVLQDKTAHYRIFEMQRDFIANASHELKTPITIIRGFAEMLHDHPNLPRETQSEMTEKIVKNCTRMANLIKDLLALADLEKMSSNRLVECDVLAIIEHCQDMLLLLFPDTSMSIQKGDNLEMLIIADPDLLELALMNLIENAAKYSVRPAKIEVTLSISPHDLTIKIKDHGIGIPSADQPHIFDRFYTVDKAHSKKMGGSGLGLSIVNTIIEKHSGRISVESELGKGSIFTIILPICPPLDINSFN